MALFAKDKIFIVTGASSGIGAGVVLRLIQEGASVVAIGRDQSRLESLRTKVSDLERLFIEPKDLTEDIEGLPQYIKTLVAKYGRLQGVTCCAGIADVCPLRAMDLTLMKKLFDINYFVPVFMAKGFVDKRNNNGAGSSLVAISSIGAFACEKGHAAYAGSKAALAASMTCIAREAVKLGIRINCISPSMIETPLNRDDVLAEASESYPLGLGKVEDVAEMIVFLLSDKAKWIAGQNYKIDCAKY